MLKSVREQLQLTHAKGMTLIELLIVMLMISFVLAAGYSMYFLGAKSFSSGQNRSDAQFECRKAMQLITAQVRTAGANTGTNKVNLLNTNPNTLNNEYFFIGTDNLLKYDDGTNAAPVSKAGVADGVTFTELSFSCPNTGILRITATCSAGTGVNIQTYSISSDIKLLNYTNFTYPAANSYSVLEITF